MKIRTQLVVLIVAALLPVALFGAVMTARFWQLQRDAYEQRFLERVRALRLALDTELSSTIRSLDALAVPAVLDEGQRAPLTEHVAAALRTQSSWATVGVVAADGRSLFHVRHPEFALDVAPDPDTIAALCKVDPAKCEEVFGPNRSPSFCARAGVPGTDGGTP